MCAIVSPGCGRVAHMALGKGWWTVRVELLGGGLAGELWPRPGRLFAVNAAHTFHEFAEAIDDAFARWDRSHLHQFEVGRLGKTIAEFGYVDDVDTRRELDADTVTLGEILEPGEEFGYVFDLGDCWRHACSLEVEAIADVEAQLGIEPDRPRPYWGWGLIPDAYWRLWEDDDGENRVPQAPKDWPWPRAPDPNRPLLLRHCVGQYTQLCDLDETQRRER